MQFRPADVPRGPARIENCRAGADLLGGGARGEKGEDHDRTSVPVPAGQAAGRWVLAAGDRLVRAAPGFSGGKAARTVRTYTEAVQWFAAAHLRRDVGRVGWEDVRRQDVQEWMASLLDRYSAAYASNQFRALQQYFK